MANLATARRFVDREARLIDRLALAAILDLASPPVRPGASCSWMLAR
jgi:hypothetical protein